MIKIEEKTTLNGTDIGGGISMELKHDPIGTPNVENVGRTTGDGNRGRTVWDYFSERLSVSKTKPSCNWYRVLFYLLIIACLGYFSYLVLIGFMGINKNIQEVAYGVDSIRDSANKTSLAVESLTKAPVSAAWFGRHKLDIPACKARGVEALQRAGGQGINATQTNITYVAFSGQDGSSYLSVIHCPEDGIIYLSVMGRDIKIAETFKEEIKKEFVKITEHIVPKI